MHQSETMLAFVLLQLIVMIGAARIMNAAFRRLRQPGVIGEIVAGLMLGPSLLGYFFPGASLLLFGARADPAITVISQIGLILLMFQIGMDFEFGHLRLRRNRRATAIVAALSVGVPAALGLGLGWVAAPVLAPGIDRMSCSLFVAVALAITAVPILGRIMREFGLTRTRVGVVAISAAAINDVLGWVMLAGVSAYAASRFSLGGMAVQLGGLAAFASVLWFVLRPAVDRLMARQGEALSAGLLAIVLCLVFGLGICTWQLGIFTIFGGFAAGLLFHRHVGFVDAWQRQVGQFVLVFFLPVFFTFTGLRTNVLGLTSWVELGWLAAVLAAAILGKLIPVYLAGRLSGFDRHESSVLATLMNTRALMELIVLNIGYDMGVLPQSLFTMLVIVAVVTTVMTGPILKRLLPRAGHVIPVGVEA